jgi:hypothetical protein
MASDDDSLRERRGWQRRINGWWRSILHIWRNHQENVRSCTVEKRAEVPVLQLSMVADVLVEDTTPDPGAIPMKEQETGEFLVFRLDLGGTVTEKTEISSPLFA